jgi:hypothetical protein
MTEITYTDAPEAYDGFGTRTLAVVGLSRRGPVRKVETPREHAEWQRMRYGSGLHCFMTEAQWADMLRVYPEMFTLYPEATNGNPATP